MLGIFYDKSSLLIKCESVVDVRKLKTKFQERKNESGKYKFRLVHQNIRSYYKNVDSFLILLQSMELKKHFVVLTKAWLNDDSDLMNLIMGSAATERTMV
ncbi:hypothetical protein J6590_061197 [Homalodisca vitripennis]|nr:hypothetical protein J6590_061197 [Homalodisca vitripennis]